MKIFGLTILSAAALAHLKEAGHEVETFAISEVQKAVAAAKQTDLGAAVTAAINDATTTVLPVAQRLEKVVADIAPQVVRYVSGGGVTAVIADVESFARELVQSVFNDAKSTKAVTVAQAILSMLRLV